MVVINPEKFEPNLGDLGMQEALRRLHDEIFEVLKVYEEKANNERYVYLSCIANCCVYLPLNYRVIC